MPYDLTSLAGLTSPLWDERGDRQDTARVQLPISGPIWEQGDAGGADRYEFIAGWAGRCSL
jgi:hypothetical protein